MEKITNKDPQDQSNTAEHADDKGLTESAPTPGPDTPDVGIEARLQAQAETIARLETEIQRQKVVFQDTEVALVTRIADVDDDRRDAATRFQRALKNQREELDELLKRQRALITLLMLLFLLIIGGLVTFVYFQLEGMRQSLATDVRASADVNPRGTVAPADPLTREKLSQLSSTVEEISVSLERLSGDAAPAPDDRTIAADESAQQDGATDRQRSRTATEPAVANAVEEPQPSAGASTPTPSQANTTAPATTNADPADTQQVSPAEAPEQETKTEGQIKVGDKPFTVQLMGFFSLEELAKFVEQNDLPAELYYQQTTYQERPWYVLIHSLHETQGVAEATVANMPKELAKLDIWIRRLDRDQDISLLHDTTR